MRGDTLLVFARAPRLGAVKRRLAKGIGAMAALRFYRGQLAALLAAVGRDRRWRTELVVTPARGAARWPAHLARSAQAKGDLGQRMQRAMAPHRRVVLVGSDIPGIAASDIAAAFAALGRAQAVFGPAEDGGYWLVGFGPRRPPKPFAAVRWSSDQALADTLANCHGRPVALLRTLRDVDTAEDLAWLDGDRAVTPPAALARLTATPKRRVKRPQRPGRKPPRP
ncbi:MULTISPECIES: TIGR04282 family arsenosugar biosynthesis glycosyltransferase [Roseomonadaceae]|uniref:TIGR04282 family arsenosugar biosynthesis glycosyltransferase n=1 Tax=Falsiroseomonas oleicola TaxID=2801474 RepID=A0ABS6H8A2_9PROT|nr:TIGR04282 family arsenosugar biosynthesis glycosyltransferase [Roseomonas oleicola]MBU8543716.1 TIGR04282 family arsenosugar biosynthesis glycosyltransferase [Roseomonas oleicola]